VRRIVLFVLFFVVSLAAGPFAAAQSSDQVLKWNTSSTPASPTGANAWEVSGSFAIGISTPIAGTALTVSASTDSKLDVIAAASGSADVRLRSNNTLYGAIDSMDSAHTTYKDLVLQPSGGNVGIGFVPSAALTQKLVLNGNMQLSAGGSVYGNTTSQSLSLNSGTGAKLAYDANNNMTVGGGVTTFSSAGSELMRLQNGFVGIGTNAPQRLLHVASSDPDAPLMRLGFYNNGYYMDLDRLSLNVVNNDFLIKTNGNERMRVAGTGNVGIGTTSPQRLFHVASNDPDTPLMRLGFYNNGYYMDLDRLSLNIVNNDFLIKTNGSERMRVMTGGNVGIGFAVPLTRVDVAGTAQVLNGARRVMRLLDDTTMAAGVGAGLDLGGKSDATTYVPFANVKGLKSTATSGDASGKLVLAVNVAGTVTDKVTVDSTGLSVTGDINATGNIAAKYQDVAEWVPATTHMEPGTVVVLNRERQNEVMPSERSYDTAVAGVVSARPGLILGEAADSKAQIATTGRVNVHVDANRGPIAIGDLLVTSDKPGTAMKSQPIDLGGIAIHRPGTVIGKALQPLAEGEGEILVLLSLQ
jgi:hypothetical protein